MNENPAAEDTDLPAWRRHTEGEQHWWAAVAVAVAIGLQAAIPGQLSIHPRYLLAGIEVVALIATLTINPATVTRRTRVNRLISLSLSALIALTNAVSAVLLVRAIASSHTHISAGTLLFGGGEVWLTNIIVFSLWYWEADRGGPSERAQGTHTALDLQFPQLTDTSSNWEPIFLDYLFVSYTNSTAFSPTDTMPLSRGMKGLFMAQSAVSLVTVLLIAARAVNILPST
jgi:uncharacterized membrane protein